MSANAITKENFRTQVMESEKPVLPDFWASWCGPCRMVGPVVDEVAQEHPELMVGKDEQPELANAFQVMSIPTLVAMKGGKIINQSVGARPKTDILAMVGV